MDIIKKSTAKVQAMDAGKMNSLSDNQKKEALTKISSMVNSKNIFPNIDLQYIVGSEQVKKNIVINQKVDNPQFVYNINTKNLVTGHSVLRILKGLEGL